MHLTRPRQREADVALSPRPHTSCAATPSPSPASRCPCTKARGHALALARLALPVHQGPRPRPGRRRGLRAASGAQSFLWRPRPRCRRRARGSLFPVLGPFQPVGRASAPSASNTSADGWAVPGVSSSVQASNLAMRECRYRATAPRTRRGTASPARRGRRRRHRVSLRRFTGTDMPSSRSTKTSPVAPSPIRAAAGKLPVAFKISGRGRAAAGSTWL